MRALRVMGLANSDESGVAKNLVCEDPSTGEQFTLACDDRLRAGARGDLSRFGQLEIELESQLRPKEIQSRIRAGATVEQVAAIAGTSVTRIERFAYPVLLERASVVSRAMKARPAIDGITAGASVEDTVTATLSARGHDGDISWDAFKDNEGWVLTLTWSAGRSENRAHWLFHPGRDGGTLSARDDAAAEIVDPALRILRPLRPVRQDVVSAVLMDPTIPTEQTSRPTTPAGRPTGAPSRTGHPAGSKLAAPAARPAPTGGDHKPGRPTRFGPQMQPQNVAARATAAGTGNPGGRPLLDGNAQRVVEDIVDETVDNLITDERSGVNPVPVEQAVARTGTDPSARPMPEVPATTTAGSTSSPAARSAVAATASKPPAATVSKSGRRGQRPAMPSWEDVLLGTKSSGR